MLGVEYSMLSHSTVAKSKVPYIQAYKVLQSFHLQSVLSSNFLTNFHVTEKCLHKLHDSQIKEFQMVGCL
jgi:hypothetical protein